MARLQRFLQAKELPAYTGYHRTRVAELIEAGEFPPPIRFRGRRKVWPEEDVIAWQSRQIEARRLQALKKAAGE
jgi:predicted DNA-binding transcriptional regulator AlpA